MLPLVTPDRNEIEADAAIEVCHLFCGDKAKKYFQTVIVCCIVKYCCFPFYLWMLDALYIFFMYVYIIIQKHTFYLCTYITHFTLPYIYNNFAKVMVVI